MLILLRGVLAVSVSKDAGLKAQRQRANNARACERQDADL